MACGQRLAAASLADVRPGWRPPPRDAPTERRVASVLFADLAGYTAASAELDPEAVQALSDRALRRLSEEVLRFGGTIDRYIGDNVMAFFGVPVAQEDHAERAVRAGLGMQAAMGRLAADLRARHGVSIDLRVGINTGEVMAGTVADQYTVTGDAVNTAAKLQAAGRTGRVTVGERTWRATRDAIDYRERKPLHLTGAPSRSRPTRPSRCSRPRQHDGAPPAPRSSVAAPRSRRCARSSSPRWLTSARGSSV